jgi:hypothetical protein
VGFVPHLWAFASHPLIELGMTLYPFFLVTSACATRTLYTKSVVVRMYQVAS